ncbi:IS3 family transposase [Pseudogracilibacillus sp. SO30301A]|uniref:IS3 family transposase n=1 Tax=Pseudogracilibacillus sp. SO30301A TaxID=3098291 RepID=UPI00300DBE35
MIYGFILEHSRVFEIKKMCEVLGVSTSGYYDWEKREPSDQQKRKENIMRHIEHIFYDNYESYGSPRITRALKKMGFNITERTVGRYMSEMGLRAIPEEKFVVTTDSKHDNKIYPNILDRDFNTEAPDESWATDITYIWTSQGWLYLAVVMDLFSRKIVGWHMDEFLNKELATTALERALMFREPSENLIHHSDRGVQYTSNDYIDLLTENDIQISMSRKGDCFDNACVESFFATLKKELVYRHRFKTREEAKIEIWKYIARFYNERRMHSTLGYLSPNEYERAYFESVKASNPKAA